MTESSTQASMLRIPSSMLAALHRALRADRSPAEAAALIRRMGFDSGEGFYQLLADRLAESGSPSEPRDAPSGGFWTGLSGLFAGLGWGNLEFEQLHPGIASLSSGEWAESDPAARTGQPACHFSTGVLADLLGRVSGEDVAVLEVECRSRGDARCRFLVGGSDALGRVYHDVREGGSYTSALAHLA